jgi:hypothetical protein
MLYLSPWKVAALMLIAELFLNAFWHMAPAPFGLSWPSLHIVVGLTLVSSVLPAYLIQSKAQLVGRLYIKGDLAHGVALRAVLILMFALVSAAQASHMAVVTGALREFYLKVLPLMLLVQYLAMRACFWLTRLLHQKLNRS